MFLAAGKSGDADRAEDRRAAIESRGTRLAPSAGVAGTALAAWTKRRGLMSIIGMLILGLVAGAIAKLIMPGKDPGGIIVTILLGIAGSFLGGFVARALSGGQRTDMTAGLIGSILGAIVLLAIYRLIVKRRRHEPV
ncbi:MAG TPA: GlsB/YeaQ/YmgE family stress response membrane protein [Longimicrobiales bacterium]|nr:GlsB/YeaQ/YmgE family stress response membrane protein [Longimicrobiales bacterium]